MSEGPTPLSSEQTQVDPLRAAAPVDGDLDARQARAAVAAGLFGTHPEDAPPPTVGRYELLDKLGAGGMGVVYRARDPELDRALALKLLTPDTADDEIARKRMVREARALARLSHPNVVQVYDVGTRGDEVFVAMEFIDGQDLAAWLRSHPDASWQDKLQHFLEAARGLSAAHAEGLVHRDFKPANVLVGRDGRVVVVDFGLARPVDPMALPLLEGATTRAGALVGTPMYMAPEQFEGGKGDARSDQFAFCVALYHALYGARPFAGDNVAAYVSNVVHGRIVDVDAAASIPVGISSALRKGLSVDPEERHADMPALVTALKSALGLEASSSQGLGPVAAGPSGAASGRLGVYLAAALAVGVGIFMLMRPGEGDLARAEAPPPPAPTVASSSAGSAAASDGAPSLTSETATSGPAASGVTDSNPDSNPIADLETGTGAQGTGSETSETGSDAETAPEPVDSETSSPPKKAPRDWCAFHEDNYRLLRRSAKRRSQFEAQGTCYTCRVERRRSRIERLHPSDCGGYQLCTAEDCK